METINTFIAYHNGFGCDFIAVEATPAWVALIPDDIEPAKRVIFTQQVALQLWKLGCRYAINARTHAGPPEKILLSCSPPSDVPLTLVPGPGWTHEPTCYLTEWSTGYGYTFCIPTPPPDEIVPT